MHRWHRDYNRAARMPQGIIKNALDTVTMWGLLLLFCIMVGLICMAFGIGDQSK